MPNNPSGPIRRAQLIVPFGTGSMVNVPGGTSLIVAGLDFWFRGQSESNKVDYGEFELEEWRLQRILGVDHFRLPPDYREKYRWITDAENLRMTVPAFRFPAWHYCTSCKKLSEISPYDRGSRGRIICQDCKKKKKYGVLVQVSFVTICENGHLNDFPWVEWVHRSATPSCEGSLKLISTGSATLGGQQVICDCGKTRSLSGITNAQENSNLSSLLSEEGDFLCPGERPWLGPDGQEECAFPVRGSLRSALNIYFGHIRSSIYLPRSERFSYRNLYCYCYKKTPCQLN